MGLEKVHFHSNPKERKESESEVTLLCLTFWDLTDCSLPGFYIHGIFQARILERVAISKKGNTKECSSYCTIAVISHASKVMLKILQVRFQRYMNCELPDVQARFRKGRETRGQIANIQWIIDKAREFQKNIYYIIGTSLVPQLAKNPPAMRETWVWSLGWEDPLEKGKATHSSILAWRIPWTNSPWDTKCQTQLSDLHFHFLLYWLCQSLWLCRSQQTVENSSRDGNTRPYLPPEKSVCRSRNNS